MSKTENKPTAAMLDLEATVSLVEASEEAFEVWLRDNKAPKARRQMLLQMRYVAKLYQHNVRVAEDALTEQKALRARDAEGYEAERYRILSHTRDLEDAHNKLTGQYDQKAEQVDLLLRVISCQDAVEAANEELSLAVVAAAAAGINLISEE